MKNPNENHNPRALDASEHGPNRFLVYRDDNNLKGEVA
tara:strand:+ start:3915 stop:4028 length:114 start_codon:yes stop_codon:yes gene_type:complete